MFEVDTAVLQRNLDFSNRTHRWILFEYNDAIIKGYERYIDDQVAIHTDINGSTVTITIEINKLINGSDTSIQNHQ